MSKRKKTPLGVLKTKARPALSSSVLVGIARSARSPNQALESAKVAWHELAYLETGDADKAMKQAGKKALACHALARIKRDYGKNAFEDFVSAVSSNHPRSSEKSTDQSKKGESTMEPQVEKKKDEKAKEEGNVLGQAQIPLKHVEYRGAVNGAFARWRVIQKYTNDAEHSVEAVYVHPLPDEATVTGCVMQIGKRKVVAELKEKEQARKEYDQAVSQGHHGALMEQERPNIFTMNVGGIEPGETIEVQIDYVQQIPWQAGGGRLTVPLVVAPRFIPGLPTGQSGAGWSPDTDQVPDASKITPVVDPQGVPYTASVNIIFSPGFRCQLACPSHPGLIEEKTVSKDETLQLNTGELKADRDFTLSYRSVSKRAQTAVYHWQTSQEAFALVNIIPPGQVQDKDEGRDVLFVLDRSYSMHGPAIAGLKTLARKLLTKLSNARPQDQIGMILFDDYVDLLAPLGAITEQTFELINQIEARGSTELGKALTFAHQQFGSNGREKVIVVITDGQTEAKVHYQGNMARIVTTGLSAAINDTNLKDIARNTGGSFHAFYPGEDFDRAANTVLAAISGPVLQDISIDNAGQLVGVKSAFADRPAVLAMRFDKEMPAGIKVSGKLMDGQVESWDIKPGQGKECDYLAQVWAREFLRENTGKDQQVPISLKYGLICQHTSFVAISEKEVPGEAPVRVEIPVELPHGWTMEDIWGSVSQSKGASYMMSMRSSGRSSGGRSSRSRLIGASASSIRPLGLMPSIRSHSLCGGDDDDSIDELGFDDDALLVGSAECEDSFGDSGACFEDCYEDENLDEACDECIEEVEEVIEQVEPAQVAEPIPVSVDTFDQNESIHNLVEALIQADASLQEIAEDFVKRAKLNVKTISSWTDCQRAKAYYFVMKLRYYGLNFDKFYSALAKRPVETDLLALAWYNLAKKEAGLPYNKPGVGLLGDEAAYVLWKFGLNTKPSNQPWSLVP
ncbi:VIT domain-containing protein [Patescibacteria group bacterium]